MPIRTFLFDLGNVLVRFSHEKMFNQLSAVCQRPAEEVIRFATDSGLLLGYETGLVDNAGFHGAMEEWVGQSIDRERLLIAASDIFELNSPMDDVLSSIQRQGYRLVLLSNTCPAHFDRVAGQWSFLDQFDHHILSYEVGALKPAPAIYHAAKEVIRCEPHECLYTDDIAEYVIAGRKHGLQAIQFHSPKQFVEDLASEGIRL
ncbi:HAD family phosphatase [bacterium]|nr:HAD family phosphatase [bacterium]